MELLVDPAVSRAKFDRELQAYRNVADEYIRLGWWVLQAEYPQIFAVLAVPQVRPPAVVFGVQIDFTNYDLWPPSVQLVDPFTRIPYGAEQLPYWLPRRPPGFPETQAPPPETPLPTLMQKHSDNRPFLCLSGTREYHQHPAHTADSWFVRRTQGQGTLYYILNQLHKFGVKSIGGASFEIAFQLRFTGKFEPNLEELPD